MSIQTNKRPTARVFIHLPVFVAELGTPQRKIQSRLGPRGVGEILLRRRVVECHVRVVDFLRLVRITRLLYIKIVINCVDTGKNI